ncbi:MAG: ATP-binding cassette domain-containing protein [Deltaproteobacteria bacterium]|nr:ATP-binding cassette domain-containing protein [Deltaproteobacteria bacterium]
MRTNRLVGPDGQGVDLDLPLDRLVVMTGPSGSGKSSLALDTLAAESRRRMLDALGAARGARLPRPPAALIANLPSTRAVIVDGRPRAEAVVCGATELGGLLAALALLRGERRCPVEDLPLASGGREGLVRALLERPEGEILVFCAPRPAPADGGVALLEELRRNGVLRVHFGGSLHRLDELERLPSRGTIGLVLDRLRLRADQGDRLREAAEQALRAGAGQAYVLAGEALQTVIPFADRPFSAALGRALDPLRADGLDPESRGRCAGCAGQGCATCAESGLSEAIRSVAIGGRRLDLLLRGTLVELEAWWSAAPYRDEDAVLHKLLGRILQLHLTLGLGPLPLLRPLGSCAASEIARLRLISALSEELPGGLLILDEPAARLDPAQAETLLGLLRARVAEGCGVLVVDHAPTLRLGADWEVAFGPGAGLAGGQVVYQGPPRAIPQPSLPSPLGPPPTEAWITVEYSPTQALQAGQLRIPRGRWTAVLGENGAGKSTLLHDVLLPAIREGQGLLSAGGGPLTPWIVDDRRPPGGPRSVVATVIGVWSHVRAALAATREAHERGWGPERFSFNRAGGRCETCEGTGEERTDIGDWATGAAPCPSCGGARFAPELDALRWRGHTIADLLRLDVMTALDVFSTNVRIAGPLKALCRAGLGYLGLGQRTDTLSGGEAQRLSLAQALTTADRAASGGVLLLDSPGAGLHEADASALAWTLDELRAAGLTIVVADPGRAFTAPADHRVVLRGGRLVES